MKIETRVTDEKRGIVQITSTDERWYLLTQVPEGTLPVYVPSVTWILNSYPKGIEFYKWLGSKGWDESQVIKEEAGDRGNKIHNAISAILGGYEVTISSKFRNSRGDLEELTGDECEAVLSFVRFVEDMKKEYGNVETIAYDFTCYSTKHGYAGTLDWLVRIGTKVWLVDFKTGQNIWDSYALQVSAYKEALPEEVNFISGFDTTQEIGLAILQVGYNRNKNKYKFTEVENKFEAFMHTKALWFEQHGGEKPRQIDIPIVLHAGKKYEEDAVDKIQTVAA